MLIAWILREIQWPDFFTPSDRIGSMVPIGGRKMSGKRFLPLKDANGNTHECLAEAFTQKHQVFIPIHAHKTLHRPRIITVPCQRSIDRLLVER